MKHAHWAYFLISTASLIGVSTGVSAQSYSSHPEPFQPRIEAGGKLGTERSLGQMEGWMPIVQDDDSVLYGDIRWMADDDSNQEGNLGLGYRAMQGDHIVGGHVWIDRRRTDRGSNFHQVTTGIEFLKEDWDIKANAYVPLNKEKTYTTANIGSTSPYLAGTGLFIDTNGQVIEEAQPGADVELGYRLPIFENTLDAVRMYGGGYGFKGDLTDDVVGGRVRASIDVNPLLNVGARFQYDEPRGSQGFIEATLRFPFTAKKRFQIDKLRARMDESPERDIDIVTNAAVDNGLRKQVVNTESGQIQRVLHVDNTAANGGDGSIENPFNTLADAQAALLDNDTLYIHQGDGQTTGQDSGIVIDKNNIQMIGSGVDFVYDTDRFTTRRPGQNATDGSLILAKTAAPVIKNTSSAPTSQYGDAINGNGIMVTAGNFSLSGVTLDGSLGSGIQIYADGTGDVFDHITISDITTINNYRGINIHANNGSVIDNVTVRDVLAQDNTQWGILASALTGSTINNILFEGNDSISNTQYGAVVTSDDIGSHVGTIIVRDNDLNGNTASGFWSRADKGTIDSLSITDNTFSTNTQYGVQIDTRNGGATNQIDVVDNTIDTNTLSGLYIYTANTTPNAVVGETNITDNRIYDNQQNGIYALAATSTTFDALNIRDNDVHDNLHNGIYINAQGGTFTNVVIDHNDTYENTRNGIYLQSANTSGNIVQSTVTNNQVLDNRQNGLLALLQTAASLSTSVSYNVLTGNGIATSNPNYYYGVNLDNDGTGTFNVNLGDGTTDNPGNNSIYNNTYRDVFVDSRPGSASGTPGVTIMAQYNWWGVNTGLDQGTRANFDNVGASPGSSIDTDHHLTTAP